MRIFQLGRQAAGFLLDCVLPKRCLLCGQVQERQGLCFTCYGRLTFLNDYACQTCGHPFDVSFQGQNLCLTCQNSPPSIDALKSLMVYDAWSKALILRLKWGGDFFLAPFLAEKMFDQDAALVEKADIIVPVPLHWKRFLRRRFNQSILLVWGSKRFKNKCSPHLLRRLKPTPSMGGLNKAERTLNVKNAFDVSLKDRAFIRGKSILLVDDVYTTGATLNACAKVLKKHGASFVGAMTVARVCLQKTYSL